jgi:hypothetical protein
MTDPAPRLCYAVLPGEHAPSKRPQRDSPLDGANRAPSPHHRLVVCVVFAAASDQRRAIALATYVCRCCSTRAWWVSRSGPAGSSPPTPPKAPAYPTTTGSDAFESPQSSIGPKSTCCTCWQLPRAFVHFFFLFPLFLFAGASCWRSWSPHHNWESYNNNSLVRPRVQPMFSFLKGSKGSAGQQGHQQQAGGGRSALETPRERGLREARLLRELVRRHANDPAALHALFSHPSSAGQVRPLPLPPSSNLTKTTDVQLLPFCHLDARGGI